MTSRILFLALVALSCSACKKSACEGNNNAQTLTHDGETREYLVYTPSSYTGATAVPVVINFHGYGGTANDFYSEVDMRSVADANNFLVIYPQGACLDFFSHWNAGLDTPDNKSDVDDLGFFDALIERLTSAYNIDQERIYVTGYSNGGMMAYALACYRSNKIAAAASVSGTMLTETVQNCEASHPTAIFHIHGTSDDVLPYNGGDGHGNVQSILDHWIGFNNTSTTATTTTGTSNGQTIEEYLYADGDSSVTVLHYKVVNGDHVWNNLNYNGKTTEQLLWDYMSQFDTNGRR